jgi:predicted DCC family thiol-disulfide oxidoreductase YuxK
MLFDKDCGFCRAWVARWASWTGAAVAYEPYQERGAAFHELSDEALSRSVHLIDTDGAVTRGAEAVFKALAHARAWRWLLAAYRGVPGFRAASEGVYRFIAGHRGFFSAVTRFLYGNETRRSEYRIAPFLFLRGLALVYFAAFVSLWVQIEGLVGANGIWPAASFFEQLRERLGDDGFWRLPTLCWWNASDGFLNSLCVSGAVAAVLLFFGILPAPMCAVLWVLYLSLTNACGIFLGYQWENLLLETGLLAIFVAPLRLRSRLRDDPPPRRLMLVLLWFLLFKLMFLSGFVKLASRDEVWWNLTALGVHYWTQPIPSWTAWYMHNAPMAFHKACCFLLFVIELGFPFLIFLPRRPRALAFIGLCTLQVVIAATGNYAYFNYLTMVLCLPLLDDACFPRAKKRLADRPAPRRWPAWVTAPVGVTIGVLSFMTLASALRWELGWPGPLARLHEAAYPFRSISSYGLFANMTEERPEIVVEGSDDGVTWKEYEFKWKPGDVKRRPGFVAPHQPRLDWQMWFAALGDYKGNPWLVNFMVRLLQGSPTVLALVEHNPFPETPPQVVRAVYYNYHFTTPEERRASGAWWRREARGLYCPPIRLKED